ncbi:MAG TPA: aldo/keto reductase [Candidatus Methylomirabilis sp.]|nr:aldo/keto reductase [Candidatus Methylomirabilis sp.]
MRDRISERRQLGRTGPVIAALGLGCMGMSDFYGPAERAESLATIEAALEAGVTLLDTGDFYGMGHNELLLREALHGGKRARVFLQVKFGAQRDPAGAFVGFDARPSAVKSALAYTLQRLGTDYVDLYQPARLDPAVPIEETIGAIAGCVRAGYVRHIGLSEVGAATIRRGHAAHPILSVQMEYSLMSRSLEADILPAVRALGIGTTAYGVLSRGLLSGTRREPPSASDFRRHFPRFQGENLERNRRLVGALEAMAQERGVTPAQLAIAWVLSRGTDIVPLIGARTRKQLGEALGACDVVLTREELARIEEAVPAAQVAGTRYGPAQMSMLDSEHPAQA